MIWPLVGLMMIAWLYETPSMIHGARNRSYWIEPSMMAYFRTGSSFAMRRKKCKSSGRGGYFYRHLHKSVA